MGCKRVNITRTCFHDVQGFRQDPTQIGLYNHLIAMRLETSDLNREEFYYLCSENKGTYQVCSYCAADLRLRFFMQLVLPYQHRCFTFSDNVSNVKLNQLMEELAHMISYVT